MGRTDEGDGRDPDEAPVLTPDREADDRPPPTPVEGAVPKADGRTLELALSGLDCSSCAGRLEAGLGSLPGVRSVAADADEGRATITLDSEGPPDAAPIIERIEEIGFTVLEEGRRTPRWKLLAWGLAAAVVIAGGVYAFQWVQDFYFTGGRIGDLNAFFSAASGAAVGLAALFGLVVGFSPFTFAAAPAVMGYVARSEHTSRRGPLRIAGAFVAGVVTIDVAVGALFATVGKGAITFFSERLTIWYALITVLLVGLALILLRVWTPRIPFVEAKGLRSPRSARAAYFAGFPFGLIACPGCTPLLLPVALGAAATGNALYGAALMGAFAVGRGLPLLGAGVSADAVRRVAGFGRHVRKVEVAIGLLLLGGAVFFAREFFRVATILDVF